MRGWLISRVGLVAIGFGLAVALLLSSALVILLHRPYDPRTDPCVDVGSGDYEQRCGFVGVLNVATVLMVTSSVIFAVLVFLPDRMKSEVDDPSR